MSKLSTSEQNLMDRKYPKSDMLGRLLDKSNSFTDSYTSMFLEHDKLLIKRSNDSSS